ARTADANKTGHVAAGVEANRIGIDASELLRAGSIGREVGVVSVTREVRIAIGIDGDGSARSRCKAITKVIEVGELAIGGDLGSKTSGVVKNTVRSYDVGASFFIHRDAFAKSQSQTQIARIDQVCASRIELGHEAICISTAMGSEGVYDRSKTS